MTIAKEFAAKLSVAMVAVAMVLSAFAATASAQTTEELQAMINDLLAQIAQLEGSGVASAGGCVSIAQPLTMGSTGADVTALQNFLIGAGESIPAGATGYFGTQTQGALASWQAKNGVAPAVGYYGPITKAAIDAACVPGDDDDDDMDDDDDSSMELSGEADLENVEIDDAEDDEVEEGAEDAPIAELTIEFADGDAEISRLDIRLDNASASGNPDAWDVFDEVSLWVDGDKVADIDAGDEDEYLDEDEGTLRFSGLDLIAEEDEELEIVIAANINNVDSDELGSWDVSVDSIRFFDADGVATTEDDQFDLDGQGGGSNASITVVEEGGDDELIVKTSSNDPDASTLQVEDDKDSDWYTVFVFDLDTDDSENDISIESVPVKVTVSSTTFNNIVDDYELVIDGVSIDDVATYTDGATVTLVFDVDGDVEIDAGDRVEAELNLKFNSISSALEGTTVMAQVDNADGIDAEGADDLSASQLSGAATGEAHSLRTMGIDTEMTDDSASKLSVDGADNDTATFEIEVEVTAFEQDVYIDVDPANSISYSLVDGTGATATSGSQVVVLSSSADEVSGYFEITEGSTETITLQVTYTPGEDASARLQLNSITFDDDSTGSGNTSTQTTLPATDYRTAIITITD